MSLSSTSSLNTIVNEENQDDHFVEFNLSVDQLHPNPIQHSTESLNVYSDNESADNSLDKGEKVIGDTTASEKKVQVESDEEESGWLDMEATNDEQVHDDKGNLLTENHLNENGNVIVGGNDSSFGYTRIAGQKQAENIESADRKSDFLFKKSNQNQEINELYDSLNNNESRDLIQEELFVNTNSQEDQLKTTKNLLTDSEKFAYVGLVNLVMVEMATELAELAVTKSSSSFRNSKFVKRMNNAQGSFGHWQRNIIQRLYQHLDFNQDEIAMIERLAKHGIEPDDLSKALKTSQVIDNPTYDDSDEFKNGLDAQEKIEIDVALTVLCDFFLLAVADSVLDARSRTLILRFAKLIGQENIDVCHFERRITDSLQLEEQTDQVWNESSLLKERAKKAKRKKYMYVGLATIGGSLVLGLSGGLLAPVIGAGLAAGLTTIGITGTSGFLAGAGGTALVAISSTAIGANVGSRGMLRRVGDVKVFEFIPLHNNRRTNLIITVSGWMNGKADDIRLPFSTVDPVMGDLYSLLWEPEMLQSTGQTIGILASEALTQSIQQILGATILMGLMSAIQLPMMLSKLSYLLDNPWNVSLDRAWKAGLVLADTIMARNLGLRPITLLGFSLGSRVIYSCLLELAKRGAYGLVEKVIIFGSPFVISNDQFILARSVVSGEFINGFSKKDWILGYLFRATSGGLGRVAGLSPIEDMNSITNFDCTDLVEGHMGYRKAIPMLLSKLGFEVLAEDFVEIDEPDPEETERQRKLVLEFDEAKKLMEQEQKNAKKTTVWQKWFKPKRKEWWEMYNANAENDSEDKSNEGPKDVFDLDKLVKAAEALDDVKVNEDQQTSGLDLAEEKDESDIPVSEIQGTITSTELKTQDTITSTDADNNETIPIESHVNYNGEEDDNNDYIRENIKMSFS